MSQPKKPDISRAQRRPLVTPDNSSDASGFRDFRPGAESHVTVSSSAASEAPSPTSTVLSVNLGTHKLHIPLGKPSYVSLRNKAASSTDTTTADKVVESTGMETSQPFVQKPPFSSARYDKGTVDPAKLAKALAKAIMSGSFDSECRHIKIPNESKLRPTAPAFTPSRFTSNEALLASQAIKPEEVKNSKKYTDRYLYLQVIWEMPTWFNRIAPEMSSPSRNEAFRDLPIKLLCCMTAPSTAGVIKVTDFPYATTKAEIIAFLGRTARIIAQPPASSYFSIHIVLDRESGKTNECYVELETVSDAEFTMRQYNKRAQAGRKPKIGDRDVEMKLSSQEEMMEALFPRTKNIRWIGAIPVRIIEKGSYYEGKPITGFQGFFSEEEGVLMRKFGDSPERNPFISRNPTRIYENMITILHKLPWYEPSLIVLAERRRIFDTTRRLLNALINWLTEHYDVNATRNPRELTPALLQELAVAALTCPGFSESQKYVLASDLKKNGFNDMAVSSNVSIPMGGSHKFSAVWPFMALGVVPGANSRVVEFYGSLFVDSCMQRFEAPTHRYELERTHPMGYPPVDYGAYPSWADLITLEQLANMEYHGIETMISEALADDTGRFDRSYYHM